MRKWSFYSVLLSPGVFPYGGSVTVSRTVGTDLMSLRPVLHVTARSDAFSVRMGTAPSRSYCVMDTWIATMDLMKTQCSAVCHTCICCITTALDAFILIEIGVLQNGQFIFQNMNFIQRLCISPVKHHICSFLKKQTFT